MNRPTDPIEQIIYDALTRAQIDFKHGTGEPLDFYLPAAKLYIEVKQFHADRIAEQMSRAENVIAIQGRQAAEWFAALISE